MWCAVCVQKGKKKLKCSSLSRVRLFATPWTVACQAPLSWDFLGKDTGVGYHSFLQGIFLTQGSNLCLLHCRQILYYLSHQVNQKRDEEGLYVHLKSSQCSRLQITFNVSWIHNAHKKSWSCESPEFSKAKTRGLYQRGKQSKMIISSRGRIHTCLCMADSLCCPPETSTILLID